MLIKFLLDGWNVLPGHWICCEYLIYHRAENLFFEKVNSVLESTELFSSPVNRNSYDFAFSLGHTNITCGKPALNPADHVKPSVKEQL